MHAHKTGDAVAATIAHKLTEPPPTDVGSYFLSTGAMNFEAALNKSRQSKASYFGRDQYS
jgi:hypothetical protein